MSSMNGTAYRRPTVATVVALLQRSAGVEEPNEETPGLTILHHGLQCAAHLRCTHPEDAQLQVAGLLHDVGHLLAPGQEDIHGLVGAEYVRPVFGERVAALVEDHVPAKRYLVAVDGAYRALLSPGSVRTLAKQNGPMTSEEVKAFGASPHFEAVVCLRRADESAKDPVAQVPWLDTWLSTLHAVAG